jgi:hypothetical protein
VKRYYVVGRQSDAQGSGGAGGVGPDRRSIEGRKGRIFSGGFRFGRGGLWGMQDLFGVLRWWCCAWMTCNLSGKGVDWCGFR